MHTLDAWCRDASARSVRLQPCLCDSVLVSEGSQRDCGRCYGLVWCSVRREEILKLCETSDDSQANRQLGEAHKFVEEARLAAWVKTQNAAKGIAPTAKVVLETASPCLAQGHAQENRYCWLRRFMARWGGRRARLIGGDTLSEGEFREKVGRVHPLVWPQVKICFAASGP